MPETNQTTTRRDVLRVAGAVTAAAAVTKMTGAPAIQKVRAANDQVTYGVIGTGSRGTYLLKHLKSVDNGRCVAICDIKDDALDRASQTIGNNPERFRDYRELLAKQDMDAVIISTPLFAHFPATRDALLAGKHVFCEKSMVFKPEEVHALRALASERSRQVLQVGLQRRYSKFYQTAKQMIDKGMLGEVTHIRGQWHRNPGWAMKGDPQTSRLDNWRLFREYSGGLTAELASHQIDVADWVFGAHPEYVMGIGDLTWRKDGRDIFDNIQLIYKYPGNRKLIYTSISTNRHLSLFNNARTEFGELIMGTGGAIQITVGDDNNPAIGLWFPEPPPPSVTKPDPEKEKEKAMVAGATMTSAAAMKGLPILLPKDQMTGNESFLEKELKFARRWLYSKGIMVPEEDRNPVDVEMESFFNDVKRGTRPLADVEVGLEDSTAVILSNLAMDEERKVYFNEIQNMGKGGVKPGTPGQRVRISQANTRV